MKTVEVGNNVKIHYVGTLTDGTEFDNSRTRGETLAVEVGAPGIIAGFTKALVGMTEGETKTVTLPPEEAYGERHEDAIQTVPMAAFGPDFDFILGGTIQGNGPRGPFLAKIHALEEEAQQVLLDMNHPLAGEQLTFNIEMVEIAGATTSATATDSDYTSLNVAELKAIAKQRGLKGYSTLKKAELIALLDN
jgi:peptidylprolyl isomerase